MSWSGSSSRATSTSTSNRSREQTFEDLDHVQVEQFLSDADGQVRVSLRDALVAIKCLDRLGTPTVAGVLFFARDPGRWLPDARISAVRFRGTEASQEFVDRKEAGGPLTTQIDVALGFLERHVPSPSRVEGWERVDKGIPTEVLREALLNAVAHRDYRAASQVRVFVFADRVELHNPGGLLNRLTIESIREGISQRRNPVVASLLARAGRRLEGLGLGVRTMIRLMRERGLPEPEFKVEGGHFRVVLRMQQGTEA
jgi:ATP-dependent DNA helicase RecG